MPPTLHCIRSLRIALTLGTLTVVGRPTLAQQTPTRIPLTTGLTLVSTLQSMDPEAWATAGGGRRGDREDVVVVDRVGADGVRYRWSFTGGGAAGAEAEQGAFTRFVRTEDLEAAPRVNLVFSSSDPERVPGATAFSLSSSVLRELRSAGQTRLSYAELDDALGGLLQDLTGRSTEGASGLARGIGIGLGGTRVYYRGTLSLVSPDPVALPLLINGRRTAFSALHARGRFALRERQIELDFFVVPDPEHPLLLKITGQDAIWQVLRVDLPDADAGAAIEGDLESECRAEIPGVYFAFAGADVRAESVPALRAVAALLQRHPAWTLTVEGHTDSIGSAAANAALSARRAEAVTAALVTTYGVAAGRLSSRGLGTTRPRETNSTLEGRARNRRVEMVRPCAATD